MKQIYFIFFFLLLIQCKPSLSVSNRNLASTYKKEELQVSTQYLAYHIENDKSRLYFKIHSKDLLFAKLGSDKEFTSRVLLSYKLFSSYESDEIIDSASIKLVNKKRENPETEITGNFEFKAKAGSSYLLEVILKDLNRNQSQTTYINIDKTNLYGRQNFLLSNAQNTPLFNYFLKENEKVKITSVNNFSTLYVRYYKRDFPIAAPPFSMKPTEYFKYKADSTFVISRDSTKYFNFKIQREGFYHLQVDTLQKEGLTLFKFNDEFWEFGSPEHLLHPLRYITSNEEYEEMSINKNKKIAVDNFWLSNSGSKEKAKENIRKYYNRVQDANNFFSSYLEGWKTDRGLIYMIYGPPGFIYRTSKSENWTYGEANSAISLNFTFVKVINPFTDNDYLVERSITYKNSWYKAIDTFR